MSDIRVFKICIARTKFDYFDYLATSEQSIAPVTGARVLVPFGTKTRIGVIVGDEYVSELTRPLKHILEVLDNEPLISEPLLHLCQWISTYYQSPLSEVIPMALPKKLQTPVPAELPQTTCYSINKSQTAIQETDFFPSTAIKQKALWQFISQQLQPVTKSVLLSKHGFSKSQLDALIQKKLINESFQLDLSAYIGQGETPALILNEEQEVAVKAIQSKLDSYHCFLLQGVTGSGKTEVYLQVIESVLAKGQQVLVLVPEIGLTPQLQSRFKDRFKVPLAIIHSNLNDSERANAWLLARKNHIKLVIGTRTALFTPMPKLGLIIIDEEHDSSLKQMEGVRYFARDAALMRAYQAQVPIILGTATPSLESLHNCALQKYTKLSLGSKALQSAPLHYQLIDLRNHKLKEGIAEPTMHSVREHLNRGKQVLIFINRRGYAPVLICHACGWMADCSACDSHLTMHNKSKTLVCHHCGLTKDIPKTCGKCHSKELIPLGTGTQRVYEYLKKEFPETAMLRIDRDEVQKKNELNDCLERIQKEDVQLIVGTQMLAKGHHFPNLTLVVVVNADMGFYNQDFRALEQLGQLLTQVSGRAGRALHPGEVLIQTHLPHNPLLNVLIQKGYEAFSEELLQTRKEALLPPYSHLALIRAQDKKDFKVRSLLCSMKDYLQGLSIEVLGPAPAPLARKAHLHRMQLLIKSPNRKPLQNALTSLRLWLIKNKQGLNVHWNVDVDPQDLS